MSSLVCGQGLPGSPSLHVISGGNHICFTAAWLADGLPPKIAAKEEASVTEGNATFAAADPSGAYRSPNHEITVPADRFAISPVTFPLASKAAFPAISPPSAVAICGEYPGTLHFTLAEESKATMKTHVRQKLSPIKDPSSC